MIFLVGILLYSNQIYSSESLIPATSNLLSASITTTLLAPTADAGADTSICRNKSIVIGGNPTGPVGATYQWSNSASLNSSTAANPVASPLVTTTYTVTVTDALNATATDQITITVNSLPSANAGSNRTICSGTTIQLGGNPTSSSANASYAWSIDDDTAANPTATPSVTSTYTVTVTDANGCSNTDDVTINIISLPPTDAGSNKRVCIGESVQIGGSQTGPLFARYAWSNSGSLNDTTSSNPTASPLETTTYTVTVTPFGFNPCTNTDQVTVTVDSLPSIDAGIDTTICAGSSVSIGGNPTSSTPGVSYDWNGNLYLDSVIVANPIASMTIGRTFTLVVTDGSTSCTATDQVRVDVDTIPIANAGANRSICIGSSTILGTSSTTAQYAWDNSNSLNDTALAKPTATPLITTVYTLTVTDANDCSATDRMRVTVDSLPFVDAGSDQLICAGDSATLGAAMVGPVGSSFAWSNASSLNNSTLENPRASPIATTNYTVTVTDGTTSCTSTDQTTLTVEPFPLADAGTDTAICIGDSVQLGGSPTTLAANTISWSPANGLSSSTAFNPTASPSSTTTYTLSVTDALSSCTNTDQITVTVNTLPTADAGIDQTICAKDSILIGSSSVIGLSYQWDNPSSLSNDTIANPEAFPATTTIYTLTTTNIYGCTAIDQVQLTTNPLPLADAGKDINICRGDTVTIGGSKNSSGSGISYLWNNAASLSDESITNPQAFPLDSQVYVLQVTDAINCKSNDTIAVNVNPVPTASFSASALCEGGLTFFTDNSSVSQGSILNWRWDFGDGVGTSFTQNPTYAYASNGSFEVKLRVTSQVGCSDSITQTVVINPKPLADAGPDQEICAGDSVQIGGSPTGSSTSTFEWSPSASLTNSSSANPIAFPSASVDYRLTVTDQSGCFSFDTVRVNVLSLPTIIASGDDSVCVNQTVQLNASGGASYEWSPAIWLTDPFSQSPISNPLKSVVYTVEGTDVNGCKSIDSVSIEVFNVDFDPADTSICFGSEIQLNPIIEGDVRGINYNWSPVESLSNSSIRNPIAISEADQTYRLQIQNEDGCVDSDSIRVRINPRAGLDFELNTTPLCLSAQIDVINKTTNSTSFEWILNGNLLSNEREPSFELDNTVENELTLIGFTTDCSDTLKKIIPPADFVRLLQREKPNVFSPNGDGVNDTFDPAFQLKGRPVGCIDFGSFQVYNRWGKLIFETSQENEPWDGLTINGDQAKEGTYYYSVEIDGQKIKGTVFLSR